MAVIMDGNGRWAAVRGLPRTAGHTAGVRALRRLVEAAAPTDIHTLTLYAFSSDNWRRPRAEVSALMRLVTARLPVEAARCREQDIRLSVIGRRDRLPVEVLAAMRRAEAHTRKGQALHVRLALDYSAREAMTRAARHRPTCPDSFARALAEAYHTDTPVPDVDLLIRTGGEQRLSDFLLWECAYAELYFTPCRWPDFDGAALATALQAFRNRQRRYGRVLQTHQCT